MHAAAAVVAAVALAKEAVAAAIEEYCAVPAAVNVFLGLLSQQRQDSCSQCSRCHLCTMAAYQRHPAVVGAAAASVDTASTVTVACCCCLYCCF